MSECVICPPSKVMTAERGTQACFSCGNRILRHLRELEDIIPTLSLEKTVKPDASGASTGFGSQSPANDAVIVHTDPRSDSSDKWGNLTDELGALSVVDRWAQVVVEERDITPPSTAYLSIPLLRSNHQWVVSQPWVDEYADELRQVHAAVRALAHDPIPQSVGQCIAVHSHGECRGAVYELDDASGVRCSVCHRRYDGLDLARFRAAQEAG